MKRDKLGHTQAYPLVCAALLAFTNYRPLQPPFTSRGKNSGYLCVEDTGAHKQFVYILAFLCPLECAWAYKENDVAHSILPITHLR